MSLATLRAARLKRLKPESVTVLIGPKPRWLADRVNLIHVPMTAEPESIDFRPMVGLRYSAFLLTEDRPFGSRVLAALEGAGATCIGAADLEGEYPCAADDGRLAKNLHRSMGALCRS